MITQTEAKQVAVRSLLAMGSGERAEFDATLHPRATNREAVDEPRDCRGEGPDAFWATALWLREAYPDLRHEVDDVVVDDELVVIHAVMSGTHRGNFVAYGADGSVKQVFAPTGRRFAVTQTHWFRIAAGLCIEHWANRDDLGMAEQLGWVPPSPAYLLRCALAKRRVLRGAAGG